MMKLRLFQVHEKMVLRNILWSYLIFMTIIDCVLFFPILKNLFSTVLILSDNNWNTLFSNVSNLLVFVLNAFVFYILYWLSISSIICIFCYILYTLKCPQYLIKIALFLTTSLILGYLYTDMKFYGYIHRHLYELFDLELIQSTFFINFLENCLIFFIISITVFVLSVSFYLRFSITFLDKIFLFCCVIVIFIFTTSLSLYKFSPMKILPTYLKHFVGVEAFLNKYRGDDFFYIESRPPINQSNFEKSSSKPLNMVIFYINHLSNEDINSQKMPFVTNFQKENTYFTRHISTGGSLKESLFTLLYGLPVNEIPSVLAHKTNPSLFTLLQHQGYQLYLNNPKSLFPFPLKNFIDTKYTKKEPFISFYNLSYTPNYLDASYQFNDQLIKYVILDLKKNLQYKNTIIIITGFNRQQTSLYNPLIIHWPDKKSQKITYITTNYDILTTLTGFKPNSQLNFNLFSFKHSQFIPIKFFSSFMEIQVDSKELKIKKYNHFKNSKYLFEREGNQS